MSDYYEQYQQDLDVGPWGRDRQHLELYALITSWSELETARDLLQFPDDAWMRAPHRAAARAVRRIIKQGFEPDPLLISMDVKQHEPDIWGQVEDVVAFYNANLMNLGGLQKSAIRLMRREYDWEMAARTLQQAASGIRNKDYEDWHSQAYQLIVNLAPDAPGGEADFIRASDMLRREWDKLANPEANPEVKPVPSGFPGLDRFIGGGFYAYDNVLVVGAPGHGKTTYMWQQAVNLNMAGRDSAWLSCEMKALKMAKRTLAQAIKVAMNQLKFKRDVPQALKVLGCYERIWFSDKYCKVADFVPRVSRHKLKHPDTFALFTDYFGALQEHGSKNPVEQANVVADAWFASAKRVGYCSFMGAQPTKNDYRRAKKPDLSFIRETGKLEQHADVILWLHSPHEFDSSIPEDYLQFWVLKAREGPRGRIAHVRWDKAKFTMQPWRGELPKGIIDSDRVADQTLESDENFESLQQQLEGIL